MKKRTMTNISLTFYHLKNNVWCFFISLVVICVTSCNQSKDNEPIFLETKISKPVKLPTFLIYGPVAPVGYTEEQDTVVTKKYGFNIKRVAGCDVTSELIDSVRKVNMENNQIMKTKYGNDWKQKFEKQSQLKIAIPEI